MLWDRECSPGLLGDGRVEKYSYEIITNDTFNLYDALKFSKHFHVFFVWLVKETILYKLNYIQMQ